MSEHTPGPWVVFVDRGGDDEVFSVLPAMRSGCIASTIENAPDASLIAAAPDLLEALRSMVLLFQGYQGMELIKAHAAINKACG